MSALATRALMVAGDDYYLTPLAHLKDEPKLLDELLKGRVDREEDMELIFLPEDILANGDEPDPELAIAYGFEVERSRVGWANGQKEVWTERLLVVRSLQLCADNASWTSSSSGQSREGITSANTATRAR